MTLAAAIEKAHAANEEKLTRGIQIPVHIDADAELLLKPFVSFCSFNGVKHVPASPQVIAAFIRAEEKLCTPPERIAATTAAIELLHDKHGLANPVACAAPRTELERILKIEPPRSWPRPEQLIFAALPPEIRAIVGRRDKQRETALRRAQNEAAEAKRQSGSADKPATEQKETENAT
jgi:hypothetical protein